MTTSGAAELVRKAGDPERATFLELFFDLVFVLALVQLSRGLAEDLRWSDAFRTLVLLGAMWWVWSSTAWLTDRTDPERLVIQGLVIATMVGSLVMAAAVPEAFGDTGLIFAGAYVAIQFGRGLVLVAVLRAQEFQRHAVRGLFWYGLSALPWIAGALVHGTARVALWALAVVLDHTAGRIGFPTPGAGRTPSQDLVISGEHLAERYRQFFIIALGELILVTGLALSSSGFALDAVAAFTVSIATAVLLWRIYIYRAGQVLAEAIAVSADPVRLAGSASYAHLTMVAGVVAAAVGDELVIAHPLGHTPPAWIVVILGGPALYLAGRARFEHAVFGRVSWSRPIGVLALAALIPVMLPLPPVVVAAAAALVLTGIAATDAVRARRRPPEPPSPPG
ncbi:low temperature requirement protein A [Micromonospora sp. PPF5-17]|uniref:Low temperature requirement protein A n=2 Tax=Micromonosporaceae TaxID=28056 RepID=A0ABX9WE35_9ACTN|nr:low temperature requirement protein A [Micromonospora sp. PPF5-17B]NES37639.1 low temperature requirement protein A [Micromonospora solifontis]NES55848.1 low temperature requirement protein A [Micromonospora sp. PPF5-6]RNL98085.1 low temperature requirement protein A [Micromonospora solifontis]